MVDERELEAFIEEHRRRLEYEALTSCYAVPRPVTSFTPSIPSDVMGFVTMTSQHRADDFSRVRHFDNFSAAFEYIRQKYNLGPVNARIAQRVNMTEDYFNRLFSRDGISERGALWAIAMGLKLSIEDAEKVFKSCGQSLEGCYYIKKPGHEEEYNLMISREGFLYYYLLHSDEYDDIDDINELLAKRGMKILGNCT